MTKTGKRIVAGILAFFMLGGVVLSAGLFKQKDDNSGASTGFDYSKGLDRDGFFEKIKASDYVTLPDYASYTIPYETAHVSEEELEEEIQYIIDNFTSQVRDTDLNLLVMDGSTVNIDYVGTVDGEEFSGGSTNGKGTDVTIGVTTYIDGFLEQLIGHRVGDEFDINVTFPEDYGVDSLNGKDAVFHITINHFYKTEIPEINDEFVSETLSGYGYGSNVEEFYETLTRRLLDDKEKNYIWDRLIDEYEITEIPEKAMEFSRNNTLAKLASSAASYGYDLDSFLAIAGYESRDAYLEANTDNITDMASVYLMVQAIAEKEGIKVSEDDMTKYFREFYNTDDYSYLENVYGKPYLKLNVLMDKVLGHIISNCAVEEAPAERAPAEEAGE